MQPYKKRAKGSWTQGKGCKGDGHERQFSKREIKQILAAEEEDYLEKHHKGARTKNMKARLEYRVRFWEERSAYWAKHGVNTSWTQSCLREAQQELKKFLDQECPPGCRVRTGMVNSNYCKAHKKD